MKDRIKAVRKELGLSQQEFAERIGIKRGAIANYEIGRNSPIDAVISLICRTFNVDELWLREGVGEMFKPRSQEDEIEAFLTDILSGDGTEFQRRFISVLAKLSPDQWKTIEEKTRELLNDK